MRVLSLAFAIMIGGGCYRPDVTSCQFACGAGTQCPSGLACVSGFCQSGPDDVCRAQVDAPDPADAPNAPVDAFACHTTPPPTDCTLEFVPKAGTCAIECGSSNSESWDNADQICSDASGWRLAVLDTQGQLSSVPGTGRFWVAARFNFNDQIWKWSDGTTVDSALFGGAAPIPDPGVDECASLDASNNLLDKRDCSSQDRYICISP